jgi:hypothetical protein
LLLVCVDFCEGKTETPGFSNVLLCKGEFINNSR